MRFITTENTSKRDFHQYMLGAVVPRPIALVSSINKNGDNNLAPFSYFNAVSSIPPVVMVSVGRAPDGSKKDTLSNIESTGEFVVNMVSQEIFRQMTLTSVAFPPDVSEFEMSGLSPVKSEKVAAFRVKESPVHFECRLKEILEFGDGPGESSIIFGEVLCIHVDEQVIDTDNRIDPVKLDIMGRLGRSNYTRVTKDTILTAVQAQFTHPVGYTKLPEHIRKSKILNANEIAILASCDQKDWEENKNVLDKNLIQHNFNDIHALHLKIKKELAENNLALAMQLAQTNLK